MEELKSWCLKLVLHYKNLNQYLDLGLKVTKVHRALAFDQSPWLKTYMNLNTQKQTAAEFSFEKGFFKLMNNSVFGKTIENLRKRVNVTLINDPEKLLNTLQNQLLSVARYLMKTLWLFIKLKKR